VPTFTTFIPRGAGILSWSNQAKGRNKRYLNWKRRNQIVFADNMILYIKTQPQKKKTIRTNK
jgi:hypothetical protein